MSKPKTEEAPVILKEVSEEQRMQFVKTARYNALTYDRLCAEFLALSSKLEEMGYLDAKSASKAKRDKKIREHMRVAEADEEKVKDLLKQIPGHPDAQELIHSLFRDLPSSQITKAKRSLNAKSETTEKTE